MKKLFFLFFLLAYMSINSFAKEYKVSSPDGKITVTVNAGTSLTWSASYEGRELITSAEPAMIVGESRVPALNESVRRAVYGKTSQVLKPVVAHKRSSIPDNFNFLTLTFKSGYAIQFRAYNDGIAYRFETTLKKELTVKDENSVIQFPSGTSAWYPLEESFMSHNERIFIPSMLDTINNKHLASLPALFKANGVNVLLTESDINDYPGMWIRGGGSGKIAGTWPKYPDTEVLKGDRNLFVTAVKDFIATTSGPRTFPWRVFVVAEKDGGLIESDLVFRLARPSVVEDTEWIKPGQVAWDWWNANNIYGVDFRAGINNDTYKYYIDFASRNGIEYIILDEGWYKPGTVLESIPSINVPELCRYGESKNVGVILWVVWKTFWDKIDEAVALYQKWGVKGIKVDFMQRDDQKVVNFYHEAARKAAEHNLLIDFHGSYKPDGLGRTYPNALTREGVMGMEHSKWSRDITPEHNVTIPFTRMVAGPMDYTPGAMRNMDRQNFNPQFTRPASQGTRVHQMALYVVFESPLQMLSDSPSNYMKEQECTDFLVKIPVVWDDLKVIDAKVGDYILLVRRSGTNWFVGALTDWNARSMEFDLSFLPPGEYTVEIFQDGINADRHAEDYRHAEVTARSGEKMKISLAPGGGWVAKISPK